jgi:hypothetical protein
VLPTESKNDAKHKAKGEEHGEWCPVCVLRRALGNERVSESSVGPTLSTRNPARSILAAITAFWRLITLRLGRAL